MMKKEIKLAIGIAVLCVVLFIGVVVVGNMNSDKKVNGSNENTQEGTTESVEVEGTEGVQSENGDSEYMNFAIADVTNYVNVRQEPNTESAILGKIYDGAAAVMDQYVSKYIKVNADRLNVREGQTTDSSRIGRSGKGTDNNLCTATFNDIFY